MAQQNMEVTLDDWKRKLSESYDAGISPSYEDMAGSLLAFIKDNKRLDSLLNSVLQEFSEIIVPRLMKQDESIVLAALDDFIARRTSVVNAQEGLH